MLKLFDFECPACSHVFEEMIAWDSDEHEQIGESPSCPECGETGSERCFYTQGTAHLAQIDPCRQREIMMRSKEIRNKVTGKTPWNKYSWSQSR